MKSIVHNKKASAGTVVVVILAILIIGGIITLLIVATQKGYFNPKNPETNQTKISAIIKINDDKTNELVISNYQIYDSNMTLIAEGTVDKDESREIKLDPYNSYMTVCWSDDYYLSRVFESITQDEINYNVTIFGCPVSKIEKEPIITHSGEINGETSEIILDITVKDKLQRPRIAIGWTSGFSDVYAKDSLINCEGSQWLNYTGYNGTTLAYDYLPEGQYICKEQIENCAVVIGSKCKPKNEELPLRLKLTHDDVFNLGRNLENETISIPIIVKKSEYATRNDEIWFTVYDMDRRRDPESPLGFSWYSELNGQDIGANDTTYRIGIN